MTTILISILSGVLGLIVGFTIGIYACANYAEKAIKKGNLIKDDSFIYVDDDIFIKIHNKR